MAFYSAVGCSLFVVFMVILYYKKKNRCFKLFIFYINNRKRGFIWHFVKIVE